jgi:hypothetical protein
LLLFGLFVAVRPAVAAELNKYLPEDTEVVVGVNVRQALAAPLIDRHLPELLKKYGPLAVTALADGAGNDKIDEKSAETLKGLFADAGAIRKWLGAQKETVSRVLLASNGDEKDDRFFVVLEGKFDRAKLSQGVEDLARAKFLGVVIKVFKVDEREVWEVKLPGDDQPLFAALADEGNLLLSSDRKDMEKALARVDKDRGAVRKEMAEVAAKVDGKQTLWIAAAPKGDEGFKSLQGGLTVSDGIKVRLTFTAKDADGARELADDLKEAVKAGVAMLKELAERVKVLAPLIDLAKKVEPSVDRTVVTVDLEVPAKVLEQLIKDLP